MEVHVLQTCPVSRTFKAFWDMLHWLACPAQKDVLVKICHLSLSLTQEEEEFS